MVRHALTLLGWRARLLVRRLPVAAAFGTACLLAAALLWARSLALDARREAVLAETRIERDLRRPESVGGPPEELARALQAFYATLPEGDEAASALRRIFRAAEKHGLVLERGEYRVVRDPAARLARYQMSLPVKGDPRAVQGFIVDALNGMRMLTLDAVSFRREAPSATEVEARLQFSLVARAE